MISDIAQSAAGARWRTHRSRDARRWPFIGCIAQTLPEPFEVRPEGRFQNVHGAFTGKNRAERISGKLTKSLASPTGFEPVLPA